MYVHPIPRFGWTSIRGTEITFPPAFMLPFTAHSQKLWGVAFTAGGVPFQTDAVTEKATEIVIFRLGTKHRPLLSAPHPTRRANPRVVVTNNTENNAYFSIS